MGNFPLSRQNILIFAQHKAEMPLEKRWFLRQFGYGNIFLHTIFAKNVLRKCASYRGRGAHFHNICKALKKNHANKHQKSNFLEQVTEIAKMNCKLWLQNGLKSKKCCRHSREQHLFWFLVAEKGPKEGDWKGQCTQKWFKTNMFESILVSNGLQKCPCGSSGEHI